MSRNEGRIDGCPAASFEAMIFQKIKDGALRLGYCGQLSDIPVSCVERSKRSSSLGITNADGLTIVGELIEYFA